MEKVCVFYFKCRYRIKFSTRIHTSIGLCKAEDIVLPPLDNREVVGFMVDRILRLLISPGLVDVTTSVAYLPINSIALGNKET